MNFFGISLGSLFRIGLDLALAGMSGGTSLLLKQAFKAAIGMAFNHVVDQIARQSGMSRSAADSIKMDFGKQLGFSPEEARALVTATPDTVADNLGDYLGASPMEKAEFANQIEFFKNQVQKKFEEEIENAGSDKKRGLKGAAGAKTFLMRLAEAMGKLLDAKMNDIIKKGEEIDKESKSSKPQLGKLSAEMTALGKELDFVSNASKAAMDAIGGAATTMSRRN